MKRGQLRTAARVCFGVYAAALFTLTHWPGLRIETPIIERPDLIAHFGAFGLWMTLCIFCNWFGAQRHSPLSWHNIWRTYLVAFVYIAFDEWSQAIPALNRFAAIDDHIANLIGVTLAAIGWLAVGALMKKTLASKATVGPLNKEDAS